MMSKALAAADVVPVTPNLTSNSDWKEIESLVYQRPCIGQEHSASFNQNVAEGHTELSLALQFNISNLESTQELIERSKKAWINCRLLHPEIAIELSTDFQIPQLMKYRILTDDKKVNEWVNETFVLVEDRKYEEVLEMTYNRRLLTKGKQSMMYLVLDTTTTSLPGDKRNHCIIWNVSHAVTDAFSIINFLNNFMQEMVKASGDGNSDDVLHGQDTDPMSVVKHLPMSPLVSYEKMYKPSKEDKEESLVQAKAQLALYKEKLVESVALYPEPHNGMREHRTHCLVTAFTVDQSRQILGYLKQSKMSITYAGAAATILATYEMYGKGHETGALLGMTRNARRWITTISSTTGRAAIPMATDVVFLWIPFDGLHVQKSRQAQLIALGHEIKKQLGKHLLSPHYLASVPYVSDIAVENLQTQQQLKEALQEAKDVERQTEQVVAASSPGFSSQGEIALKKEWKEGKTKIVRTNFIHTGRQVGASPWIGMYTVDESITFSIGFDGKYYSPEPMERFLSLVRQNVASLAQSRENPASSKL